MPPRDPNLPEGTDSIIDGGSDLPGAGGSSSSGLAGSGMTGRVEDDDFMGSTPPGAASSSMSTSGMGSSGMGTSGAGSTGLGGTSSSYTSGSGASGAMGGGSIGGSDFGGGSIGGTDFSSQSGGGQSSGGGASMNVQSLKAQATDKVRDVAVQGKERATEALGSVSQLINETAQTVDERLGPQYGQYVRQAGDALEGLGTSLQGKNVDELFDDARNLVRRSPAVAIGAAAAVGFLLVRLVKSGMPPADNDGYGDSYGYDDGSTRLLGSPPRVDNSYDPVA